jgi:hypothetical protein
MTKIEIKNRFTGSILFEYSKENNTIKDTIIEAIRISADLSGADLSDADLRGADLRGADLSGADLRGAYLSGADLRGAYLSDADLRGAYLRGAYLSDADLRGADLRGADLRGADLSGIKIFKTTVFTGLYTYIAMPIISEDNKHYIRLGCYTRLVEEWENDFWNNESEFPNDNSLKSQYRVMAYELCKKWLELNKKENDEDNRSELTK